MIAVAAALAEIALILAHRRHKPSHTAGAGAAWSFMAAGLGACAAGWLVIGRPGITWDDLSLTLTFGVVIASEAGHAAQSLSGRTRAGWATVCVGGAASATWLLPGPLPFT
ncbi:hypothetical protein ACF07T_20845 [Streptomyces sp. NPDC015184]|uniref:hypothetical protein n=1 Tax=Streptomyces sp. NPDC015184 TaxID=3364946 RepID=UPI0036F8BDF4